MTETKRNASKAGAGNKTKIGGGSRSKSTIRFSLGRRIDVYMVLFESFSIFVENIFQIMRNAPEGEFPEEELTDRFAAEAGFLTAVFTGQLPGLATPVPGWNGDGLGRRLRQRFALDLLALPAKDAEIYEEDRDIVHFGMLKLVDELQDIALDVLYDDDGEVEKQSRRLHECLAKWSELLSNSSEPLIKKKD